MFFTSPQTEERKTIEMNSNVSGWSGKKPQFLTFSPNTWVLGSVKCQQFLHLSVAWKMLTVPAHFSLHTGHTKHIHSHHGVEFCACAHSNNFKPWLKRKQWLETKISIVNWWAASCRNYWIMWVQNMHNCAMKGHSFKNVPLVLPVSFDIPVSSTIYVCGLRDEHFFCSHLSHICILSTHKAKTIHSIPNNVCVGSSNPGKLSEMPCPPTYA
jgi:hypothetical protein